MKRSILVLLCLFANLNFAQSTMSPDDLVKAIKEGRAREIGPKQSYMERDSQNRTLEVSHQNYEVVSPDGAVTSFGSMKCKGYCVKHSGPTCGDITGCKEVSGQCTPIHCGDVWSGIGLPACSGDCGRSFSLISN